MHKYLCICMKMNRNIFIFIYISIYLSIYLFYVCINIICIYTYVSIPLDSPCVYRGSSWWNVHLSISISSNVPPEPPYCLWKHAWMGLREHLQDPRMFHWKKPWFPMKICPLHQSNNPHSSLIINHHKSLPIHWRIVISSTPCESI